MTTTTDLGPARTDLRAAASRHLPTYRQFVAALVLVWGLGDAVSTYVAAAATGSVAMEANPVVRTMLAIDPLLLVLLKAAVVVVVAVALLEGRDVVERVPGHQVWFAGCLGLGTLVTANNLAIGVAAFA